MSEGRSYSESESVVHLGLKTGPEETVTTLRVQFALRKDSSSSVLAAAPLLLTHGPLLALETIVCKYISCPVMM